jgi:hypothetical protein
MLLQLLRQQVQHQTLPILVKVHNQITHPHRQTLLMVLQIQRLIVIQVVKPTQM